MLQDHEHRQRAVTHFDQNLSITAGAGAGKTSLLIERMLHATLARGMPLAELGAITFTEKAAAELRARLELNLRRILEHFQSPMFANVQNEATRTLERLASVQIPPSQIEQRVQQALKAEKLLDTIHGFAAKLLRRWPEHAGLPSDFEVDDGTQWSSHVKHHWIGLFEAALQQEPARWKQALRWVKSAEVQLLAERLAMFPDDLEHEAGADCWDAIKPVLEELRDELARDLGSLKAGKSRAFPETLENCVRALEVAVERGPDDLFATLHDQGLTQWMEKSFRPPKTCDGIDQEECAERIRSSARLLKDLGRVDQALAKKLLSLVWPLSRQLRAVFYASGRITFAGLLIECRRLLQQDLNIRRAEQARLSALFVDEFQDTDPLQCEIAFLLCEDPAAAPAKDPWQTQLKPGKLVLVGDPKQSIYRFRGADLEIYHAAVEHVLKQNGLALTLRSCFRSPPAVIAPINQLFSRTFDAESPFDPQYDAMVAEQPDSGEGPKVELWQVGHDKKPAPKVAEGRRTEGAVIAAQINAWLKQDVRPGDIAVLLWSLTQLSSYLRPLRQLGIPCVVDGGNTFVERTEVNELFSVLLAAADPTDAVAFLGALRSSFLGVPDPDIRTFCDLHKEFVWQQPLSAETPAAVADAITMLRQFHERLQVEPAAEVMEGLLGQTNFEVIAAAAHEGAERIANVRKLIAITQHKVRVLGIPLADGLRQIIDSMEGAVGESESSLADEYVDAVRIMTIHKAKGLEFPRVVVADVGREERESPERDPRLVLHRGRHGSLAALEIPRAGIANLAMVDYKQKHRLHLKAESKRLFYVATTRAQQQVVLVHQQTKTFARRPWLRSLQTWGYGPQTLSETTEQRLAGDLVVARRQDIAAAPRSMGPAEPAPAETWRQAVAAFLEQAAKVPGQEPSVWRPSAHTPATSTARRGGEEDPEDARNVGSACHLLLERFGPEIVRLPVSRWSGWLKQIVEQDPDAVSRQVEAILTAAPCRALLEELLGYQVLGREVPVITPGAVRPIRGSIDVVFAMENGILVADYKTDAAQPPATLAARHGEQLRFYARALQTAWELPELPRAELLLLRTGQRIAIPEESDLPAATEMERA